MSKSKVIIFTTGGTIMSRFDSATGTIVQAESGDHLLSALSAFDSNIEIEAYDFCNRPSPHMDPAIGLSLSQKVRKALEREDISGAVIAHGTDTIEEMSYLTSLILSSPKPVVFTGAMKSSSEEYIDNIGNLLGAIRIAADPRSRERGIMVFFNQDIFPARCIVKGDTNHMNSFLATEGGPMGAVINGEVIFYHSLPAQKTYDVSRLDSNVQLIKAYFGMSPLLIDACTDAAVDGIVIEALGAGNLPPSVLPSIRRAIGAGIPVIIASRCLRGPSLAVYAYEGGGAQLKAMGCIFSGNLNGTKARIQLMVLKSACCGPAEIAACFAARSGTEESRSR